MKRILLVDDEPAILQSLRMILTMAGYEVETAWSSQEALELAGREAFDLMITDFNMPGMKGDELAVGVKACRPGLPVLMLSGSAEILRATGRALPAVDVLLGKPFRFDELRREIERLLAPLVAATSQEQWSEVRQGEAALGIA